MSQEVQYSQEVQGAFDEHGNVSLDRIAAPGAREVYPVGVHTVRATNVSAQTSYGSVDDWEILADFVIVGGEHAETPIRKRFSLKMSPSKTPGGPPWAPGVYEALEVLAKIYGPNEKPLLPVKIPHKAAQLLAKAMQGKLLILTVIDSTYKDKEGNTKPIQRLTINGVKGAAPNATRQTDAADFTDDVA